MSLKAPEIDSRNSADINKQVVELLKRYAPEWKDYNPETNLPTGVSAGIIGSFARFCEIIIQRINQVPYKNFLAFFDMLGASLQPPQPARVPLTFSLAEGNTNVGFVPAGTRVASPPGPGEKDPVIFETEKELTVTPARLTNVISCDPVSDKYADLGVVLKQEPADITVFEGKTALTHVFYIGSSRLGLNNIKSVDLHFKMERDKPANEKFDDRELYWDRWDGKKWVQIVRLPYTDETHDLRYSEEVNLGPMDPIPPLTIAGIENRWIRCRLDRPVSISDVFVPGMVREWHIPRIKSVSMSVAVGFQNLAPQAAAGTFSPLDLTNPFFPFGEKPKFGDTFYLACDQAFSLENCEIKIKVGIVNPSNDTSLTPPPVKPSSDLELKWEFWDGKAWSALKILSNSTDQFTKDGGAISFTIPAATTKIQAPARRAISGIDAYWIRVRIEKGNYGTDAYYVPVDSTNTKLGYGFHPDTYAPPIVKSISIDYAVPKSFTVPEKIVISNGFSEIEISDLLINQSVRPFVAMNDTFPTLYMGFALPTALKKFPNRPHSFYMRMVDLKYGEMQIGSGVSESMEPPKVSWEYWDGKNWSVIVVRDGSENLTRSGIIEFLPPSDFTRHTEFAIDAFWIRAVLQSGKYRVTPRLNHILLNTVMASQTITIRDEVVGSSDQTESLQFKTSHAPVLAGQKLMVRETEIPAAEELAKIKKEEGEDAIIIAPAVVGKPGEVWVRWHEVNDFYGSKSRDRHYCIDHLTGTIIFGNSLKGMIPPQGAGNIKMAFYQTGGGVKGNRVASTITQLKTTLPYIEKVINTEDSSGGADGETVESLIARAPASLRHGNRSVALEDYEDLAKLASYSVARAKCIPLLDLKADPYTKTVTPGVVSVVIVPRTAEKLPVPTLELIDRVQRYLLDHCVPTAEVNVVGPLYLNVDITVNIVLSTLEGAGEIESTVDDIITAFLHPLTGGFNGKGWEFGRIPKKSDIYSLLSSVQGINHISSLSLVTANELEDHGYAIQKTGRFLNCSGKHTINLSFVL